MNFKRFHESKNLFSSTWEQGVVDGTTGQNVNSPTTIRTEEYVPIHYNSTYSMQRSITGGAINIRLYAQDKTYIGTGSSDKIQIITGTSAGNPMNQTQNFCCFKVIDSSVAYVRMNDFTNNLATQYMMVEGEYTASTMPEFEPYSSEVWHDIPHYVRGTSTDTLTLPQTIYGDGTNATVNLKGNEEHTGTPSPQNPVMSNGTGERTGNLFDKNATDTNNGYVADGYLASDGAINTNNGYRVSEYIPILPNQKYITYAAGLSNPSVCFYDTNKNYISGVNYAGRQYATFTTPSDAKYLRVSFRGVDGDIMFLNLGDTVLPYEPYGYKIPISNNSQTTNVYLGEVQTTRRIKKLVLTGQENFGNYTNPPRVGVYLDVTGLLSDRDNGYSSHFVPIRQPNQYAENGITFGISNTYLYFTFASDTATTLNLSDLDSIKAWFQQQYANGTPVTVWYVLATETTGIVNEPLMKIGNYSDSLTTSIPTTDGANTLSVGTTVQPSEVTANYHGWHEASVKNYIHNGIDIITTLPVTISADGNAFVGLQGNMSQSSTPSPATPIQPQECGERTAQLWFIEPTITKDTSSSYYAANLSTSPLPAGTYTFSAQVTAETGVTACRVSFRNSGSSAIVSYNIAVSSERTSINVTLTEPCYRVYLYGNTGVQLTNAVTYNNIMLNSGDTALPYEPYGQYKIPISSGGKNLFDEQYPNIDNTVRYRALNVGNGTYTLSSTVEISTGSAGTLFFLAGNVSSGASTATNAVYKDRPITVTSTDGYVTIAYRTYTVDTPVGKQTMLNLGSTPLPYEPYNRTTTPVYLGEVQTTRQIRKYEFTGQESGWGKTSTGRMRCALPVSPLKNEVCFCSHYVGTDKITISSIEDGECTISAGAYDFVVYDANYTSYEDYSAWVAQQYSAGTPVTVWYILATEETGIVNEPLRKIGDYADTIDNISIPTITGEDIVDVETTLKPSKMKIKYNSWCDGNISYLLTDTPLCGIDTYKDTLNLATGSCTRQIKKIVLDSTTVFTKSGSEEYGYFVINLGDSTGTLCVCSHFVNVPITASSTDVGASITETSNNLRIRPENVANITAEQFNQWIVEQYNTGTPVTVWYILATPATETITVPTGLFGTEEGYLNQSGTPTPTNPIYPTANKIPMWN